MLTRNVFSVTFVFICFSFVLRAPYSWSTSQEESSSASQTFMVEKMTCATCPIMVKKAMSSVHGVLRVEVNFEDKTATAIFDPSVVSASEISQASTAIGFPTYVYGKPQ